MRTFFSFLRVNTFHEANTLSEPIVSPQCTKLDFAFLQIPYTDINRVTSIKLTTDSRTVSINKANIDVNSSLMVTLS